ncbi:jg16392 [Pararge aegeria aegeria]|uniref:Jg16392 protein n=1 Tax=Pararge aegeria aegeria TaxID=348720 RepID=A0A8S4SHS8_9NEOP|nr:jg16392 [Pararge aegeria aegeria]
MAVGYGFPMDWCKGRRELGAGRGEPGVQRDVDCLAPDCVICSCPFVRCTVTRLPPPRDGDSRLLQTPQHSRNRC